MKWWGKRNPNVRYAVVVRKLIIPCACDECASHVHIPSLHRLLYLHETPKVWWVGHREWQWWWGVLPWAPYRPQENPTQESWTSTWNVASHCSFFNLLVYSMFIPCLLWCHHQPTIWCPIISKLCKYVCTLMDTFSRLFFSIFFFFGGGGHFWQLLASTLEPKYCQFWH